MSAPSLPASARRPGVVVALTVALLTLALCAGRGLRAQAGPPGPAQYLGARACAECHKDLSAEWHRGRHSKMFQPATADSVVGDFGRGELRLRGQRYVVRAEDGGFFVSENLPTGKLLEHRVDFTLGNRRIQHYLTRREDGRIVVLPPSWDVQRRQWFHNMEIVRPDEKQLDGIQVWNKNCDGCHVSEQRKGYDAAADSYATSWRDFGTNCERCHGPGSRHAERFASKERYPGDPDRYIVRPTRLEPQKAVSVCAQCHSLRDVVAPGYQPGDDYYDHFMPILEYGPQSASDPAWWADGRPRRFSNDALGLVQSACFLKGRATCTACHRDPHEPDVEKNEDLRPTNERLCARCHAEIARAVPAHSRHAASSPGSSCVECHMPPLVFSIKAAIRDHTLSVPAPENTARFGIPNACGVCHKDKKPEWAEARLREWFGPGRRARLVARAEAFTLGRQGKPEAVARLMSLAADREAAPLVRANALGHLSRYPDSRARQALLEALRSDEALLRAVAALNLGSTGLERVAAVPALTAALHDSRRVVRVSAAFALVGLGVARLDGEDGEPFEAAKADYVARGRFHSDDAQAQLDLGKFLLLSRQPQAAQQALLQSRRLDPAQPVDYFLGLAEVLGGRRDAGLSRLKGVAAGDPFFEAARAALRRLQAPPPRNR